jgi:hypothetical protein
MPDVVYCSFCGRSSKETGQMWEKTDKSSDGPGRNVFICLQCAAEAVEILSSALPSREQKG